MPAAFFATEPSTIFLDLKNDISCEIVGFFCYLTQDLGLWSRIL